MNLYGCTEGSLTLPLGVPQSSLKAGNRSSTENTRGSADFGVTGSQRTDLFKTYMSCDDDDNTQDMMMHKKCVNNKSKQSVCETKFSEYRIGLGL